MRPEQRRPDEFEEVRREWMIDAATWLVFAAAGCGFALGAVWVEPIAQDIASLAILCACGLVVLAAWTIAEAAADRSSDEERWR